MKSHSICLVLALIPFVSFGQTGNYFMTHYSPKNEDIDRVSFDIAQDNRGVLYFANKAGFLEFDGRNWNMIKTPAPIYTICVTPSGNVFGGGLSGFGRISTRPSGREYETLTSSQPAATNIFNSLAVKDQVFFISANNLYVVDPESGNIEKTLPASAEQGMFKNLFEIDGDVYISTEANEILLWKNEKLERSKVNPSAGEILFSDGLTGSRKTLLGTSADRVFVYESGFISEITVKDVEYLHSNVLVNGAWVNESLVALATLRGGVLFIDPRTGDTQEITNYYTGLPDNEVYALLGDSKESIWVAHDYGFTRIAPFQPFRTFNHYPGLEGNLLCAYSAPDDGVYIGTSLGLFKLVKDEVYEEEEYFVTRKKKVVSTEPEDDDEDVVVATQVEKARRGLFGLKKKDRKKQDVVPPKEEPKPTTTSKKKKGVEKTTTVSTRERRTRKVLKALQYKYVRVHGINGKVTHLIDVQDQLMAAGLDGVFIINDLNATALTAEPVRSIFLSPSLKQLFVSTYNEEIKSYKGNGGSWQETHMLDSLQEYVSYMFEDKLQNLWLCGRVGVIKIEMIDNEVTNTEHIPYLKPSIDETVGLAKGSDVYVVNAGEFQMYDHANDKFVKYDSLPGTRKYFASAGAFWFHDGHRWRTIDERITKAMQLEWLGLFPDIRFLTPVSDGKGLWVITADNELYRFMPSSKDRPEAFPLFLKGVRGPQEAVAIRHLSMEEEKGALTFEFVQPDYNGFETIEYRYLLSGLSDIWSAWSPKNNEITFPYLPSGEYEIQVQSMNIFGKVSEVDKIQISVLPPYWRQPWFYGLEVAVFSILVLLSVRLSVVNPKYKPISRVLSLLTVIMVIQLIQSTADNLIHIESSPVIEFLIQVLIALLVLPLEARLRRLMEEASEGKFDLGKMIGRKKKGSEPIL